MLATTGGSSRCSKIIRVSGKILDIQDLIGRYQAEGQHESTGGFTLAASRAAERLSQFQLPSRYHWILKVIQAAHCSGARRVQIDAGITSVRFTSDAAPEGLTGMEVLLAHLLSHEHSNNPALRHLAAGLQGSLAVKPRRIGAAAVSEGRRQDFLLESGGWRDAPASGRAKTQNGFVMQLNRNWKEQFDSGWFTLNTDVLDYVFKRPASFDRENRIVYDSCSFSAMEVRLGRRLVSDGSFGRPRFPGYQIRKDPSPGQTKVPIRARFMSSTKFVMGVADPRHHLIEKLVPAQTPGGFRVLEESHATVTNRYDRGVEEGLKGNGVGRALAIRMELAPLAQVLFIEDGVILSRQTLDLGCRGFVALVDARELRKDLSTLHIIEDDKYERLLELLKAEAEELKKILRENRDRVPDWGRIEWELH